MHGVRTCVHLRTATPEALFGRISLPHGSRAVLALLHARWFGRFTAALTHRLARLHHFPDPRAAGGGLRRPRWTTPHDPSGRAERRTPDADHGCAPGGPVIPPGSSVRNAGRDHLRSRPARLRSPRRSRMLAPEGLAAGGRTRSEIRAGRSGSALTSIRAATSCARTAPVPHPVRWTSPRASSPPSRSTARRAGTPDVHHARQFHRPHQRPGDDRRLRRRAHLEVDMTRSTGGPSSEQRNRSCPRSTTCRWGPRRLTTAPGHRCDRVHRRWTG